LVFYYFFIIFVSYFIIIYFVKSFLIIFLIQEFWSMSACHLSICPSPSSYKGNCFVQSGGDTSSLYLQTLKSSSINTVIYCSQKGVPSISSHQSNLKTLILFPVPNFGIKHKNCKKSRTSTSSRFFENHNTQISNTNSSTTTHNP